MAVTLTDAELASALAVNDALALRLLPVSVALVERFAPAAPEAVQNEAVVRFVGWLLQAPSDGRTTDRDDTYMVRWAAHGQRGFLLSGAQDLPRPWHVQSERAGVI